MTTVLHHRIEATSAAPLATPGGDVQALGQVALAGPAPTARATPGGLRVLLADDNVDFAESLAILLEAGGHQVVVTHDGVAAMETAAQFGPDVCFLDIGLPRMHGYDLARRLRATPATRSARLVAVSGWGQPEDKRRSREAGFDHHLAKPVEFKQIQRLLDEFTAFRQEG